MADEEAIPEYNVGDKDQPEVHRLDLFTYINPEDGTVNVALGHVDPAHLGRIFAPDFVEVINQSLGQVADLQALYEEQLKVREN